jgi:cell wall-associated NlpC family hydrolase
MIDRLVGVPYVEHGRDYEGSDCWGLVYLFYRDILQAPIPSYSAEMHERGMTCRAFAPLIASEVEAHWQEVAEPSHGAVALMRNGRHPTHVGVMLDKRRLLHTEGPGPSCIERIDGMRLRSRLAGFYRLKDAS